MRFIFAAIVGAIVVILGGAIIGWRLAALCGWNGFGLTLTALIWFDLRRQSARALADAVRREDVRGTILDAIVTMASIASIVAVIMLISSKDASVTRMLFGLFSIAMSWATVHTLYALRYAEMYYSKKEGGIDFNNGEKPRFMDFAYFSFTIGMTYQVSDTNIVDVSIRHAVLGHALISFVFGVAIIATSLNSVASLVSG